ncbi:iron complex transport system ATP-binding protein [Variovorax sp. OK605]|jgi:ABC-type cobalamin/Fe3+-siderophores transport system ATPase subunit|uniref:ABC transporter ATP-binding protein n=1 Tax=Variovorax sp. OK605 TaxID=1855317 RepID=UPI0008F2BA68|nr:ABC transporter ATP-binding protein [Variovorax sp. OK605]SFP89219.1 iron complex transport system ATP-binding protein [Variovorax sp. OK605]
MSEATGGATAVSDALVFDDVSTGVGRHRFLLDRVSLAIPERGLLGIVGPNGSGKTTLLRTALGLMPLSSGRVLLRGRPLPQWPARAFARHIGYVAQQGTSHWDLSVTEMLRLHAAELSPELVERCELEPLLARRFATLSGGEKARVSVARALAHGPALLLADEPAAHLDIPHHHRLMAMLRETARQRAVVVVLHDLHVASAWCERLALLSGGRLLAHGTPAQVLTPALLSTAYGAPIASHEVGALRFFTGVPGQRAPA